MDDDFTSSLIPNLRQDDDIDALHFQLIDHPVPTIIHPYNYLDQYHTTTDLHRLQDLGGNLQAAATSSHDELAAPVLHDQQHPSRDLLTTTTTTTIIDRQRHRNHEPSIIPAAANIIVPADSTDQAAAGNTDNISNDMSCKQKKALHRDIERQRRQEMSHLYASLRNLLPAEYIKGKRSTSDHVHQAANYIRHREKNIRELKAKRDKLRNLAGGAAGSSHDHVQDVVKINNAVEETPNSSSSSSGVAITLIRVDQRDGGGFEILMKNESIMAADDDDDDQKWGCRSLILLPPLSRVLEMLFDEGLTVTSCVCTKVDGSFLYTIQTEASHVTHFDTSFLQQKLTEKVMTWPKNI